MQKVDAYAIFPVFQNLISISWQKTEFEFRFHTCKELYFAVDFSVLSLIVWWSLLNNWKHCCNYSCPSDKLSSRYVTHQNSLCRVLEKVFFSRSSIKVLTINFVPIEISNSWWYIFPSSFPLKWVLQYNINQK